MSEMTPREIVSELDKHIICVTAGVACSSTKSCAMK